MTYLDVETTGLSITQDRIVQIGCIKNGEEKKILINPGCHIPEEVTAIHGITDEMVKDAPTFKQIAKSLNEYLDGEDLGGYNSDSFDIPMLMEEFNRAGVKFDMTNRKTVDVYKIECKLNSRKLAAVYKRMTGKELEDAHDAMADTRATAAIHKLQMSIDGIEDLLKDEDEINYVDFTKKIYLNKDNVPAWAFGKNKDKEICDDRNYCNWVLRSDFTQEVKDIVNTVING